jgi:hypothetical protein
MRRLLAVFLLSVLAAPVEYLAHEGAHFAVARLYGLPATLHFDRVTLPPGTRLGDLENALFAAAGPAVDWIVGLTALTLLVARYTPLRLVLAIWVARPLQFLPGLIGIDLPVLGAGGSLDGTDEGVVAAALGLPAQGVIGLELAAAMPLLGLIAWCVPAPGRLATLATLTLGVLLGWAAWLAWGAFLLP